MTSTDYTDLRAALSDAGLTQAEFAELIAANDPRLNGSQFHVSRIVNGMKPGPKYRAAIPRALAEKGINFRWEN